MIGAAMREQTSGSARRRTMRHSLLTRRLDVDSARVWDIHYRARERRKAGEDVILLTVGDPDFDTPPAIVDEAARSMRRGRTRYGPTAGDPPLREAIARYHQRITRQRVDAEEVVVFAGGQSALFACALCIADPGDEFVVFEPRYVTYDGVIDTPGAVRVDVPLATSQGFGFDPDALGRAVTPRTRAILLNTPHNPTGLVAGREELEAIAAIARRNDLWVLSDEVYAGLTYDAEHVAIAGLPGMAERSVTINSLSKSHAMQGWRLGWAVGPRPLARHLTHLIVSMVFGTPPFTQDAALFALTHEFEEVETMERAYRARRDLVCTRINACPGLACQWPQGGMYALADVRGTGLSDTDFAWDLLDAEGVSVLPAATFGASAVGHVRISLTAPVAVLEKACDRIERYARSLGAAHAD